MMEKDPAARPKDTREVRSRMVKAIGGRRQTGRGLDAAAADSSLQNIQARPSSPGMAKCSIALHNVASNNRCRLVRSGSTTGVLIVDGDMVQIGDRMVLLSDDSSLPQARLVVDVTGFTLADGHEDCAVVQWVRIVCADGFFELQAALTVLGVDADVSDDGLPLGEDEFLVYEPFTQKVRRISLGN